MRLTGLLALLLFLVVVLFAAPAASFAQDTTQLSPQVNANAFPERALTDLLRRGGELERDGVCYTMRTYVMAREEKDSDVTRMVKVTRCLPGNKIEFKSAVQPIRKSGEVSAGQ
jgi:hypothetical protein